eukprot:CAMPEP_0185571582 /NCGR_PEP_ID=MMETSP0434-20130131/3615_1 /TAXON_ID=626734 ORGANISM="Favella taraikaensis, Strain Fe Narragansett Bay" /NCGR_SAMPLE_ID=MMETSP0434 /ASSEMBLY_ACC=CAM_ASM_000379 /LENGTH=93 /DNA_ID=CAMNT_0028187085 /DNA_START=857 /DNA_END=1139 /DNA_ORIENTATION=-
MRRESTKSSNIGQFVGPAIETTLDGLALTQPHAELVAVNQVCLTENLEGAYSSEDVGGVALSGGHSTEGTITVLAAQHEVARSTSVDVVEAVE